MHSACRGVAIVPAACADPNAQSTEEKEASHSRSSLLVLMGAASLVLVTYNFAIAAWLARRDPGELAFVAGAYAALAALFLCLRRVERLTPDSPTAERRRLHFAVWALSAGLSCAFAYRVSLLMPAALVVIIWCMTSFVVLMGFYLLVLCNCNGQRDNVGCEAVGESEPFIKKARPTDEMV
ncbi:hypothetical protein EJB05_57805, partial [Eragrostis curvula]